MRSASCRPTGCASRASWSGCSGNTNPAVAGYLKIVAHYEGCLQKHGDSHLGVDWPNQADAHIRYRVMLDLLAGSETNGPVDLLDFGCGASHLYEFLQKHGTQPINYSGLDLSEDF